jgi:dGTPase
MIEAVIEQSLRAGSVVMDDDTLSVMHELRDFMFERVYQSPEQRSRQLGAIRVLHELMEHHLAHPEQIPDSYRQHEAPVVVQVADYVAGMTDRYALATHERLFGPDVGLSAIRE